MVRRSRCTKEVEMDGEVLSRRDVHREIFEGLLLPPRKWWMDENPRMGLFDAAALALTFFYSLRGGGRKPSG
jgi:hypothetical protein